MSSASRAFTHHATVSASPIFSASVHCWSGYFDRLASPSAISFCCCHCMNFLSSASDSSGVVLSPPGAAIVLVVSETAGCEGVLGESFGIRIKKTNAMIAETPIPAAKPVTAAERGDLPIVIPPLFRRFNRGRIARYVTSSTRIG